MGCFKAGDKVTLHYRSALVHGTVVKQTMQGSVCASSRFLVHEEHTTVDGKVLIHTKEHFGSALHAA